MEKMDGAAAGFGATYHIRGVVSPAGLPRLAKWGHQQPVEKRLLGQFQMQARWKNLVFSRGEPPEKGFFHGLLDRGCG